MALQSRNLHLSDYSLSFLKKLKRGYCEKDVEQLWTNRVFPLIQLADFSHNWSAVRDDAGIFYDECQRLYRVEPQSQHISRLREVVEDCDIVSSIYEGVIFAKIMHQLFVNMFEATNPPVGLRRIRLVAEFQKLPRKWRDICVKHDLHLYHENKDRETLNSASGHYSPLAREDNFRLLGLLPATDPASPIHCTMQQAIHDLNTPYEALSYNWGSSSPIKRITLNGTSFKVTENLQAALRNLRLRDSTRTLWVDAVCINQSDVSERNSQVTRINQIYQKAAQVIVWLGKESNTSFRLLNQLNLSRDHWNVMMQWEVAARSFPFVPVEHCAYCANPANDPRVGSEFTPHYSSSADLLICKGDLLNLLRRTWWKRMWVLQEFVTANRVIFVCGSQSVEWKYLQVCLNTMVRQARRALKHLNGRVGCGPNLDHELMERAKECFPFFFLQTTSPTSKMVNPPLTLPNLLALTRRFESTDPRDKVFALLNLLTDEEHRNLNIQPRYDLSVRQIFVSVTKAFIMSYPSKLDAITALPPTPTYLVGPKPYDEQMLLPSWVPDWTSPLPDFIFNSVGTTEFSSYQAFRKLMSSQRGENQTAASAGHGGIFNACYGQRDASSVHFTDNDEVLHVRGKMVDKIASVSDSFDLGAVSLAFWSPGDHSIQHNQNVHSAQMAIIQRWKSLCLSMKSSLYRPTGQPMIEAFWRATVLDRHVIHLNGGPGLARLPQLINKDNIEQVFGSGDDFEFPPSTDEQENNMLRYLRVVTNEMWSFNEFNPFCVNLRFFITSQGYLGVGHPNCLPGDKVVVLLNSSVPLMLREYSEGHVLVGESYVHGIMDGEIIRETLENNDEKKEDLFQWFSIV